MAVLAEVLGTRYIYDDQRSALENALKLINEPIDLKGCKFTPSAESVLRRYYTTHQFYNSVSPELDTVLKHNTQVVQNGEVKSEPLSLDFNTKDEMLRYLKDFDHSKVYNLSGMKENDFVRYRALATLIMLKFPDVVFDLGYNVSDIFSYVRADWLKASGHHDAYWEAEKSSLWKREVVNGKVYVPGVGTLDEKDYIARFEVLPYEFGNVSLWRHPEFTYLETTIVTDLFKKVKTKRKIIDSIELYKEK